jgi:hypothetical protein
VRHVNIFFIVAGAIGLLLTVLAPSKNRRTGRRVFWVGFLIAVSSAFFIAYPPDWRSGISLSLFAGGMIVFTAYRYSPYIKLRGKIYAFHVSDSLPDPPSDGIFAPGSDDPNYEPAPDAYGGAVTASKFWWSMVAGAAMCALGVVLYCNDRGGLWEAALSVAIVVLIAVLFGHQDASWGYPIARGQHLQLGVASAITAGVFTLFYLGAYYAGKRWPWRNRRSLEYQAHPRHQKRCP